MCEKTVRDLCTDLEFLMKFIIFCFVLISVVFIIDYKRIYHGENNYDRTMRYGFWASTITGTGLMNLVLMVGLALDQDICVPAIILMIVYCLLNLIAAVLAIIYIFPWDFLIPLFFFISFALLLLDIILFFCYPRYSACGSCNSSFDSCDTCESWFVALTTFPVSQKDLPFSRSENVIEFCEALYYSTITGILVMCAAMMVVLGIGEDIQSVSNLLLLIYATLSFICGVVFSCYASLYADRSVTTCVIPGFFFLYFIIILSDLFMGYFYRTYKNIYEI